MRAHYEKRMVMGEWRGGWIVRAEGRRIADCPNEHAAAIVTEALKQLPIEKARAVSDALIDRFQEAAE